MRKKFLICIITSLSVIIVCILCFPKIVPFILISLLFIFVLYIVNRYAVRNIESQRAPFQIYGSIRNVDYLIIGDMIKAELVIPPDKSYVQIKAPDRGLNAAFEILKHTSSILNENNGNVVLVVKKKNINKEFSIFDAPFFYNLTIKKYHIEKLLHLSRKPLIIKPFTTLKLLFNICNKDWVEVQCPDFDIITFCEERHFNFKYYE